MLSSIDMAVAEKESSDHVITVSDHHERSTYRKSQRHAHEGPIIFYSCVIGLIGPVMLVASYQSSTIWATNQQSRFPSHIHSYSAASTRLGRINGWTFCSNPGLSSPRSQIWVVLLTCIIQNGFINFAAMIGIEAVDNLYSFLAPAV
ncbi:hypothetical protein MVEN_02498900 [Mycena venus]|uniref:Uncharacterized protein n=1 Tax=Mycena venus TaxID=2733690 RepID=A0A8H6WY35_9AGAR|nr:hypothetical protein MVEN_02498900 [Mycena venus]